MLNRLVIVGGGISGLTAAYYASLKQLAKHICVIESSGRLGGWIFTKTDPFNNVYEMGPKTIRCVGDSFSDTIELVDALNLKDQVLSFNAFNSVARKRYIYDNDQLYALPSSANDLFTARPPFRKAFISHIVGEFLKRPSQKLLHDEDISVREFIEKRFDSEIADYIFDPMVVGICAGQSQKISARLFLREFVENGSFFRHVFRKSFKSFFSKKAPLSFDKLSDVSKLEKWSTMTFKNGLSTLIEALEKNLISKNVEIRKNMECTSMKFANKQAQLQFNNAEKMDCDLVVSSIAAKPLSCLMQEQYPLLSEYLRSAEYSSIAIGHFVFEKTDQFKKLPSGFGYLVTPKTNTPVLGVIFDSNFSVSPNKNHIQLTVMMGGAKFAEIKTANCSQLAVDHLRSVFKFDSDPIFSDLNILNDCIPQYNLGYFEKVKLVRNFIRRNRIPLVVCGASYDGISINDIIRYSKQAVSKL